MARKKITHEQRFAAVVCEIGIDRAQQILSVLSLYESAKALDGDKKSPGTDPDSKARRRRPITTTGGTNDKPAE